MTDLGSLGLEPCRKIEN